MARCSNWPAALTRFLEEKDARPFDWKSNNCALFACDWIRRLTGKDPARGLRRKCTSAIAAGRIVAAEGGMLALASSRCAAFGWPTIPHRLAQRGDLILAQLPECGLTLGVVINGGRAAFPGASGVVHHPMSVALVAWRIT